MNYPGKDDSGMEYGYDPRKTPPDLASQFQGLSMQQPTFASVPYNPNPWPPYMPYDYDPRFSNPSSPYLAGPSTQPFWSPPMSPAIQFQPINRSRHGSIGEFARYQPGYPSTNSSPYQYYTPQVPSAPTFESQRRANRMSWSGPSRPLLDQERKPYHPQPPARRSDWVMWVGNVPANTSHEELWKYFNENSPPGGDWRGPSSIFLISRSSCAFVNLSSQEDLDRAVGYFNNKALRPWDSRCPRMVCRVRRKDDDLRAGVGAQRGTGMHREWVKTNKDDTVPPSPAILEHPPDGEGRRRESIVDATRHRSTNSLASTNSSFLARHFPKRIFIMKSMTIAELEDSVKSGTWRTQRHNEPILDQAFRTSPEVFLIFGANKAGGFFGYAKMIEHIDKSKSHSGSSGPSKHVSQPGRIKEEVEDERDRSASDPVKPKFLLSPGLPRVASSPGELTPAEEVEIVKAHDHQRHTEPSPPKLEQDKEGRAQTMPSKTMPSYFAIDPAATEQAKKQEELGGSTRKAEMGDDGVLRKDTVLTPQEKQAKTGGAEEDDSWGHIFNIQWIKIGNLPFHRTRHLRNPWNADREVKVSRDGTEVEPNVGSSLMAEWDRL